MPSNDSQNLKGVVRPQMGFIQKLMRVFTVVYRGEGITLFLLTLNIFLVLTAYSIIKPVREALILAGKGAEWKSYLAGAQAILMIFVVKGFSSLASKVARQKLISWVTLFFISNLGIFYILSMMNVSLGTMGILFYVWMGIFNMMVVAQFWAFANDLYSHDAGKRLFPIVMFGSNLGAFFGAKLAGWLVKPIGLYQMMLVSGVILGICIVLTLIVHRRETAHNSGKVEETQKKTANEPLAKGGGFQLVFRSRYLLYIAFLIMLLNLVNTTGEYILGKVFTDAASSMMQAGMAGGMDMGQLIGKLYADFHSIVNILAMVIQLFLVSRIFKWVGVRGALFILPLLAFGGNLLVGFGAVLTVVKWSKTLENSTDYSLMNTVRHALFLVTSREVKYKAKAAIDTFFVRAGDVFSALLVFIGTTYLAFNVERFAVFNVVVAVIWLVLCVMIIREHKKLDAGKA